MAQTRPGRAFETARLWRHASPSTVTRIRKSLIAGVLLAAVCTFFVVLSFSERKPSLGISALVARPSTNLHVAPTRISAKPPHHVGTIGTKPIFSSKPTSRRQVEVHAENAFSRLGRIIRSNINAIIEVFEDPENILEQAVVDMRADLAKMRQASARALASRRQIQEKYDTAKKTADEWYQRAELALKMGEEGLAREALSRKKTFADVAKGLKTQLDFQQRATDNLVGSMRQLEAKLAEAQSKKNTLKARAASARTQKQVSEMISGIDTSSSLAAFEKMEEKVMRLEAEGEASLVLSGGDSVDQAFRAMESGHVEDDLQALKKSMSASRSSVAVSSPSSATRRKMDLELEMLKKELFA